MNLKQLLNLLLILPIVTFLVACNSDDTVKITAASEDAQIYKIKLSAIAKTKDDTTAYAALATTVFAIDQVNRYIYNPVPLPFNTNLKNKFKTEMTLSSQLGTSAVITILYTDDTHEVWNREDSISYEKIKGFEIKPLESSTMALPYRFELRKHTIDQDTILWDKLQETSENLNGQKAVARGNDIFCFYPYNNKMYVSRLDKNILVMGAKTATTLPANIKTESITVFNNEFYAVSESGHSFRSTDANGVNWTDLGNKDLHNIVGVLPGLTSADDILLAILKPTANGSNGKYTFASTKNMSTLTAMPVKGNAEENKSQVDPLFPSKGFTWVSVANEAKLVVTAGSNFNNAKTNETWHVTNNKNQLEITAANIVTNNVFTAKEGVATFIYDKKLYAMNDSVFVTSSNLGSTWKVAPAKQAFDPSMSHTTGQSVIVDSENYIWIFGGVSNKPMEIYRGRLNKLIPKI